MWSPFACHEGTECGTGKKWAPVRYRVGAGEELAGQRRFWHSAETSLPHWISWASLRTGKVPARQRRTPAASKKAPWRHAVTTLPPEKGLPALLSATYSHSKKPIPAGRKLEKGSGRQTNHRFAKEQLHLLFIFFVAPPNGLQALLAWR